MNLLGFETSSAAGSVALQVGSDVLVRSLATPREQTEQILRLIDELLAAAGIALGDLDGIAFGRGPGSFTGLRVSAAVAQGLAAAAQLPLLPVSSLLCLAERAWREERCERCLLCLDAHMGEVYWAESARRGGVVEIVGREHLAAPSGVVAPTAPGWAAVGNGFVNHAEALSTTLAGAARALVALQPSAQDLFPRAAHDLEAGHGVAADEALPVYLREHTAWRRRP